MLIVGINVCYVPLADIPVRSLWSSDALPRANRLIVTARGQRLTSGALLSNRGETHD
jgi:hypothetical protein